MSSTPVEGAPVASGAQEPPRALDGAPAAIQAANADAVGQQQPEREEERDDVLMLPAFQAGDMVVCPNPRRAGLLWPGVIVDPREAPDEVRRGMKAACHCVMLLGPSGSSGGKSPLRDFAWAPDSAMRHIDEGLPPLPALPRGAGSSSSKKKKKPRKPMKPEKKAASGASATAADDDEEEDDSFEESVDALRSAIEEALALESGTADATPAESLALAREAAAALAKSRGTFTGPPCSSCGSCLTEAEVRAFKASSGPSSQAGAAAAEAAAAAAAAAANASNVSNVSNEQPSPYDTITPAALLFLRRGGPRGPAPGRCDTCQQLASEGNFCPCCHAAWHAGDRDMVCCDSCSLWVHFTCDPREGPKAAREGESCNYSCPACRRAAGSAGLVSELAAAEAALRAAAPRRARSAYNLFAVDAHRSVGAAALASGGDFRDALRAVAEAWRSSAPAERAPFEAAAKLEAARAAGEREAFRAVQSRYLAARTAAAAAGVIDAEGKPVGEAAVKEAAEAAVELRRKHLDEAAAAKKRKGATTSTASRAGAAGAGKKNKGAKRAREISSGGGVGAPGVGVDAGTAGVFFLGFFSFVFSGSSEVKFCFRSFL